jgi:hypothetical protein
MFAMSAVAAVPALAETSNIKEYEVFRECPIGSPPIAPGYDETQACVWARSNNTSYFQAGKVTVHLVKPITLLGGFEEEEATEALQFIGAQHNNNTLKPVQQPGPSLTEGVNPGLLPPTELVRYEKFVSEEKTKVNVAIELAGPATDITLNEGNLLGAEGTALGLPVEIHLSNGFLGKHCYVGSHSAPINIALTTGTTSPPPPNVPITGSVGTFEVNKEGTILTIANNSLVNNSYAAPGVNGCGVNGEADAAVNAALGLPSPAGTNAAVITGTLKQAGSARVAEHLKW